MKKSITLTLCVAVALLALAFLYSHHNAQHPSFEQSSAGSIAVLPLSGEAMVNVTPDVSMRFDTGSCVSLLTEADAERLRRAGATVTEQWFPSVARDVNGKFFTATRRYFVDLPVLRHKYVADSTGSGSYRLGAPSGNVIRNLVFLPAPEGSVSTIGTDVLEHFIVEYLPDHHAIVLHRSMPEGYQFLSDIEAPTFTNALIGCGDRYYIDIEINNFANRFFIDSGNGDLHLKLPMADTLLAHHPMTDRVYTTPRGDVKARMLDEIWLRIGNRTGSRSAYYTNSGEEDYVINPLGFFRQDVVIDFRDHAVYVRPNATFALAF